MKTRFLSVFSLAFLFLSHSLNTQDHYPLPHQSPRASDTEVSNLIASLRLGKTFGQAYLDENQSYALHDGLDFFLEPGTPIYAVKAGTILLINSQTIIIGDPFIPTGPYWTFSQSFQYYDRISPEEKLKVNDEIKYGQRIGQVSQPADRNHPFFFSMGIQTTDYRDNPNGFDFSQRELITFYNPLSYFSYRDESKPTFSGEIFFVPIGHDQAINSGDPISSIVSVVVPFSDEIDSSDLSSNPSPFGHTLSDLTTQIFDPLNRPLLLSNNSISFKDMVIRDKQCINLETISVVNGNWVYGVNFWGFFLTNNWMLDHIQDHRAFPYFIREIDPISIVSVSSDKTDGNYRLVLTAKDFFGNTTELSTSFEIHLTSMKVKKSKDKR